MARLLLALLAILGAVFLGSCGGASAATDAAAPEPTLPMEEEPPPAPAPPPPPGADAALEAELRRLAALARAGPMQPAARDDENLVELGRALFFDRILSGNKDISCYTCHDVGAATGDGLSVSIGTGGFGGNVDRVFADGTLIPRNAPALFRLSRQPTMFLDSRVARRPDGTLVTPQAALNGPRPVAREIAAQLTSALAAQAMFPPTSREEMRGQPGENEIADATDDLDVWRRLMVRLVGTDDDSEPGIAGYRTLFAAAFPGVARWSEFHFGHVARAIAAFEVAAFETRGSAFDRWLGGDPAALSADEKRGGALFFGRARCADCHDGPALTDGRHHAIGVPQVGPGKDFPGEDTGRGLVTGDPNDRYRFRTPTLRNVAIAGPWMHDGAYTTLEAAVRHYIDPERSLRNYDESQLTPLLQPTVDRDPARQDARARAISPLVRGGVRLSDREVAAILAFLGALTDDDTLDIEDVEPETVPSGLPIDDDE